jgi:hypothetical protein
MAEEVKDEMVPLFNYSEEIGYEMGDGWLDEAEFGKKSLRRKRPKVVQEASRQRMKIVSFVPDSMEEWQPSDTAKTSCPFAIATEAGVYLLRARTFWLAVSFAKRWANAFPGVEGGLVIEMCYG